jgi:4-hydroxy-3-methylbut-2-en-1-yl diphosphate synthase IspG/GcpE
VSKIIEIIVNAKGETTVTTKGFAGANCREASKFVEQALGQRIDEQLTAEFHQTADVQQSQSQQTS